MTSARVALIGFGRIAPKHIEAVRAAGAEVVASCNRSAAGREKAAQAGIAETFDSIEALVERAKPDAVICSVSFFEMFDAARRLIPFGVPTLLEKPPGTSVAELDALRELAARHRTPVMVGVNRRHYSVLRSAIDDAGGPSRITQVDVDWSEDAAHFLSRGFTPAQVGKMVFGNSLHGLDLLTYLAGPVAQPQVSVRRGAEPFDWNMALQGTGAYGAVVSFRSSWSSPGRWRLQFCSPGRRYVFAPLETCLVQQAGVKDDRAIVPAQADVQCTPGFLAQTKALLQMRETRRAPDDCSLDAVAPSMHLAEALSSALTR